MIVLLKKQMKANKSSNICTLYRPFFSNDYTFFTFLLILLSADGISPIATDVLVFPFNPHPHPLFVHLSVWPHTEHLNPVDLPLLPSSYLSSRPSCIFRPVLRTTATIGARVRWILNLVPHPGIPTPCSTNEDKETGRQKGASTSGPRSANFFLEGRGWDGQRKFSFQAAEWFPFRLTVSRFFQSSWFFVPLRFLKQRTACFRLIVYLLLNLRWKLRVYPFEENNLRPARLMLFLKLV